MEWRKSAEEFDEWQPNMQRRQELDRQVAAILRQLQQKQKFMDPNSGAVSLNFSQYSSIGPLALSPDCQWLAAAHGDHGELCIYEVKSGKLRAAFQNPDSQPVLDLEFAPDGKHLQVYCVDGTTVIWDVSRAKVFVANLLKGHHSNSCLVIYFADGNPVARRGADTTIRQENGVCREPPFQRGTRWQNWFPVGGILALGAAFSLPFWLFRRIAWARRRRLARPEEQIRSAEEEG